MGLGEISLGEMGLGEMGQNRVIKGCMTKWLRFFTFVTFFERLHTFSRTLVAKLRTSNQRHQ